jgi:beta-glucosidase
MTMVGLGLASSACTGTKSGLQPGTGESGDKADAAGGTTDIPGSSGPGGAGGRLTTGTGGAVGGTSGTGIAVGGRGGTVMTGGEGGISPVAGATGGGGSSTLGTSSEACDPGFAIPIDKYAPGYTPDPGILQKVKSSVASMSLDDKIAQMTGVSYGSASNPQFNDIQRSRDTKSLRGFRYREGPRGVDLGEDYEGTQPDPGYATAFPVSMARGAAFDLDLEYAIGEAIADEMVAAKQTLMLAPTMNLMRHPLWGRAQEAYSEDPYHTGRMASAMVVGIQQFIPANAKEFLGYSIEKDRPNNNTAMEDEQTLREIYGRHFRMVVQDAGVASVMAAYNKVSNIKCTQSAHLLTKVLRDDFGFKGFVLSEWFAMPGYANPDIDAATLRATAKEAIMAGLDVELPWEMNYGQLKSLLEANMLSIDYVDKAVGRILEQKFRFKVDSLDGPWGLKPPTTTYRNGAIGNNEAHIALAQKAAEKSMVLLKNEKNTLPIPASAKKIAVLGASVRYETTTGSGVVDFANDIRTGDLGSSRVYADPVKSQGPYDGIRRAASANDVSVIKGNKASDAQDADFIVVVAGLTAQDEGEEYNGSGDRTSLALDAKNMTTVQNDLITAVAELKKPMVVVLEGGAAIDMPWLSKVPAVVMAWYPGQVGGTALARLLFGQISFSGKLPVSWPASVNELPVFNGQGTTKFYYDVGYRYYDRKKLSPLYPFGFGLSYVKFDYRKLRLGCSAVAARSVLPVYVTVANKGSMDADEIIMAFVSFPDSKARRASKELKAFSRVSLKAGEEKEIMIPLRLSDLDTWDNIQNKWIVESGDVKIQVGSSSADLPLSASVTVK